MGVVMKKLISCALALALALGTLVSAAAAVQADSKNVSMASSGMVRAQDPLSIVDALLAGKYKARAALITRIQ